MQSPLSAGVPVDALTNADRAHGSDAAPAERERLEATCLVDPTRDLHTVLHRSVAGQDHAVDKIICSFARVLSGLRDPGRPLLTMLLLGPTGVGKTETAKALARALFGNERAMTRINAEEYAHGHEISKLLGSPPGYVGHQVEPLLSQNRIDAHFHDAVRSGEGMVGKSMGDPESGGPYTSPVSIVLVDEVEKADPRLWNALLGILEDGTLTLGSNETTDFTNSIILLTSNVGSREMGGLLHKKPMGFQSEPDAVDAPEANTSLDEIARRAAQEVFPAEFLSRFDELLVYRPLDARHLELVFEKFLEDIQQRATTTANLDLRLRVSDEARAWLVREGTDARLGARPLRRDMEKNIVDPISRLIAAGRIHSGDTLEIELEATGPAIFRTASSHSAV